ncbi:hypothetical protein FB451DRAFT_1408375 [Mycena latifolia]|nr:hypothetical protein FB451DRAFT_1408375 [Mycena latifolia]
MRRPSPFRLPRRLDLLTSIVRPVSRRGLRRLTFPVPQLRTDGQPKARTRSTRLRASTSLFPGAHRLLHALDTAAHRSVISSPSVPCRTASAHDDLPSHALLHHLEAAEGKEHTETKVRLTMFLSSP